MSPTIVIDTREQNPLRFEGIATRRGTLAVGDYSLAGLEDQIVIERKSLSDLLGTITHGRERFIRELRQLRAYRFAGLVIETDWPTIEAGIFPQAVHPNAVVGSLMAFTVRYNVVPILALDHDTAGRLVQRLLCSYARMVERDYQALADVEEKMEVAG